VSFLSLSYSFFYCVAWRVKIKIMDSGIGVECLISTPGSVFTNCLIMIK
jgi:hypothetical protein